MLLSVPSGVHSFCHICSKWLVYIQFSSNQAGCPGQDWWENGSETSGGPQVHHPFSKQTDPRIYYTTFHLFSGSPEISSDCLQEQGRWFSFIHELNNSFQRFAHATPTIFLTLHSQNLKNKNSTKLNFLFEKKLFSVLCKRLLVPIIQVLSSIITLKVLRSLLLKNKQHDDHSSIYTQ